jgi:hypothetical protein
MRRASSFTFRSHNFDLHTIPHPRITNPAFHSGPERGSRGRIELLAIASRWPFLFLRGPPWAHLLLWSCFKPSHPSLSDETRLKRAYRTMPARNQNEQDERATTSCEVPVVLDTDLLIIGAGPAGASLACFLAQHGILSQYSEVFR